MLYILNRTNTLPHTKTVAMTVKSQHMMVMAGPLSCVAQASYSSVPRGGVEISGGGAMILSLSLSG